MGLGFSVIKFSTNSSVSFDNAGQLSSLRSYLLEFSYYVYDIALQVF